MDDTGGAESTTLQAVPTAHHEMASRRLRQTGYGKLVFGFQVGTIPGPIPGTSGILFLFLALGLTISMKWPPGLSLQPAITLQAAPVAACDNPAGGPICSLR